MGELDVGRDNATEKAGGEAGSGEEVRAGKTSRRTRQNTVYSLDNLEQVELTDNNQSIYKQLEIPDNDQKLLDNVVEKFSQWNFDAINYHQTHQQQGFMFFCLKIISGNVGIKNLGIPLQPLLELLREVYARMQSDSKALQSAASLVDNLQALHYFLQAGNVKRHFSEADVFGLIVALVIYNFNNTY